MPTQAANMALTLTLEAARREIDLWRRADIIAAATALVEAGAVQLDEMPDLHIDTTSSELVSRAVDALDSDAHPAAELAPARALLGPLRHQGHDR